MKTFYLSLKKKIETFEECNHVLFSSKEICRTYFTELCTYSQLTLTGVDLHFVKCSSVMKVSSSLEKILQLYFLSFSKVLTN